MSAGIWFWLVFVLCLLFGLWADWPANREYYVLGGRLVVFVLLGLLGWKTFGPPIQ